MTTYTYISKQGDRLDRICNEFYGFYQGAVEHVLRSNARLARYGPSLPAGVVITLSELPAEETPRETRIFD